MSAKTSRNGAPGKGARKVAAKKTVAKESAAKKSAAKKSGAKKRAKKAAKPAKAKGPRRGDLSALQVDPDDRATQDVIAAVKARAAARKAARLAPRRMPKRSAVDRLNDPPPLSGSELVDRVSRASEHELRQIEIIVAGRRVPSAQRSEAERRARTLASLARTLNEVKRLRAEEDKPKAADDDAMPRDLEEFRRELSRRLALLDAGRAQSSDRGDERERA
jgi:hypothetical protein